MNERKRPGREPGDAGPTPLVQRKARAGAGATTRSLPAVQRREADGLPGAAAGPPRVGGGATAPSASGWLDTRPFSLHVQQRADATAPAAQPAADTTAAAAGPAQPTAAAAPTERPTADVHAAAAHGISGAAQALPFQAQIQASFGPAHDVSGIRAHVGGPAADGAHAMGARAFATGTDVAFAAQPDLHTAAHEAAHVVQQQHGVSLYGGVGQAGDPYERHADAVADRVVAGQSAADLLAPHASTSAAATTAVQRKAAPGADGDTTAGAAGATPAVDAAALPAGVDYQAVGRSLTVIARTAWLDSGPLAERMLALLTALHDSGALGWATSDQLAVAAQETRLASHQPGANATTQVHFSASIYNFVGVPPGVPAMVTGSGDALIITMAAREFDVAPGTIVEIAPARFVSLVDALERFTGLAVVPAVRGGLGQIHTDGFGGHGVLTFRFQRDALDQLFGKDAYQQWSDERTHGGRGDRTGAAAVGATGEASDLSPAELDRLRAWLAANLPTRAGVGGRLDPEVLKLVDEIDQSPYRDGILAALRSGGDGHGIDAITLRRELNAATFDAQATAHGATVLAADQRLDPVWDVPVPAQIHQDAGRVTAGENVGFTLAVDIPPGLMSQEQLNRLRFRPFVTSTSWVFEKIDGATGPLPPAPPVQVQRVVSGNHTFHHRYTGVTPQPMDVVFELPQHAPTGTWRVTALVQHSHFASAVVETQVLVKTQATAMAEARAEVAGDMGELIPGQYDFDTGLLNNHVAKAGTDDGDIFFSHLDESWQATSSADRAAHRDAEMENLRSMIARLRADNHGGHDAAIASAERQLAKLEAADHAIAHDEADGWQPFELRGTFLSTKGGIGDGPLDLYGLSQTRYHTETAPRGKDMVADPKTTRTPDGVRITIRDLSRRFDGDDRAFTGDGRTFEDALAQAFVKLCQAYPPGEVFVMAQSMGNRGDHATREGVGFQLKTGSIGRDIKEAVFDPVVNTAVNLAGMATMIFLPGSASLVMPALIAYNATQTVDDLVRRYEDGTLRTRDLTLGVAQIGLDILPYLGRATAVAGSSRALFVLRGVDIAGEVVVMTAGALTQARDIQEGQVAQLAQLYAQLVELESSTHAADPRLVALRQQFDQQAKDIRATTYKAFASMIEQRALFAGAKHVFAASARAVGDLGALSGHGAMVDVPGVDPHYDRATGRILGDASKLAPDAVDHLLVERALHLQELAATAAGDLGVDPMKIEVVLDDHLSVTVAPDHVRLGYAPGTTADQARARWKALAVAGGGHASAGATPHGGDGSGPPTPPHGGDHDAGGGGRGGHGGGAGGDRGGPARPNVMARVDEVARPVTVLVSGTTHLGGGDFVVDVGGGTAKVKVVTVDQPAGQVNVHEDRGVHHIELPRDMAAGDVESTLARGLAEVAHTERRRATGDVEAVTDALGEHGTGKAFSPRDYGLVAELRTLRRQRLQAEVQGEAGLEQLPDIDRRIADVEQRMGFHTERGAELRRMVEVQVDIENDGLRRDSQRARLDGERGHAGIEVHTHWMGIVDVEVFRAKAAIAARGKDDGSWVPLLEQIASLDMGHGEAPDGTITKRSASGDAISIARRARDQARTLLERGTDPELGPSEGAPLNRAAEAVAEQAARHALITTPETDFNSSYEIRDELVKHTFAAGPRPPQGDKGAAAEFANRGYDEYTREALLALAADGVGYTEPSNSAKKMQTRFGEDRVNRIIGELIAEGRLQPGQVDLRFLTMVTTNQFGGRPPDAPSVAVGAPPPGSWDATRAQMVDQLKQKYVGGIDIAGQEFFWFDPDVGGPRLRQLYGDLVAAAKARGERLVLRPHVGEGAVDTAEGKPYGRDDNRHRDADGGLPHYQRARHNLDAILTTLEGLRADGLFDATLVEVRFGHATHATPAQAARMKALGITAEVNLGSNVVTGAVDQTAGADGKPQPTEQFDDHALPTLLYYETRTILSTDAHSVMSTNMREEYLRAQRLIEQVLSGARRIRIQAADAGARGVEAAGTPGDRWLTVDELTADERRRFTRAYEKLYADANDYYQRRPGATPVGDGNARTDAAPDGGRHATDTALAHGLVATHGDQVFEGAATDVAKAAQAYQRQGYLVTPLEEADGLTVFYVRSGGGDVDLELRAVPASDAYRDMPVPAEPPRDLGRADARLAYNDQIGQLPVRLAAWEAAGVPLAERARRAYEYRHRARGWTRDRMDSPGDTAALEVRDVRVHGTPDGPSFEELVARGRKKGKSLDETYQGIIESSMRPNAAVNARYGVRGASK